MPESDILRAVQLAISEAGYRAWRNNVGMLIDARGVPVRYGLAAGSGDLIGIGPAGRFLSIEVKTERGLMRPAQARWLSMVRSRGGIAGVARSPEEALAVIGNNELSSKRRC